MGEEMEFRPSPQLEARLVAAAEQRAKFHGKTLGDGAEQFIRDRAEVAAEAIQRNDAAVDDVRPAFEKLIDEMVKAVNEIPGYADAHPNVIGEQTLSWALSRLCPLFPFC
jgi:hypothetical protein